MNHRIVLDAGAFDSLTTEQGRRLRRLLREATEWGDTVCCAAVTLAEVCRGRDRTRRVEVALARSYGGKRIEVVPTDKRLAKLVGAILHDTRSDSARLADAHVLAVCAEAEAAMVLTSDSDDIASLADAVSGTRVVIRNPAAALHKS